MSEHSILYNRNNFVLIRHLQEENKYSLGTSADYNSYFTNAGFGFPVDQFLKPAEQLIDTLKAWQQIDIKHADVNRTYEAEQEMIEVLERELVKETDIIVSFKNVISEMENKDFQFCMVHSALHEIGLCVEDNNKNLYCLERYYDSNYLDRLIKLGHVVKFERVPDSLNQSIGAWEKNYMDVSAVKDFIQRRQLVPKPSLDNKIAGAEQRTGILKPEAPTQENER